MGCGGSTEVSSATAVAVEDATTSCVSDTPPVEDIAIDYDLDGEEMDLVELVSEATSTVLLDQFECSMVASRARTHVSTLT